MGDHKEGMRLIVALSIIVGISLIGQLGMSIIGFLGKTLLPFFLVRVILDVLFWFAFIMLVICIYKFIKLSKYFKKKRDIQALASLGLVIAIAHVGQFAVAGLNFFRLQEEILPEIVIQIILYSIFWTGFAYIIYALYMYRKI